MKNTIYILLLDRFMRGETSEEEERQLLSWFRTQESREEIQAFYRQRWQDSEQGEVPVELQERMLQDLRRKMQDTEKELQLRIVKTRFRTYLLRLAAAACILLLVGTGVYKYVWEESAPELFVVSADKGQKANMELPDGTRVWLNSGTKLKYDKEYNASARHITLDGEAYFEVAKNKEKPFVVHASGIHVEALGTRFNVKAYGEDNQITTTLLEGKVRVSDSTSEVTLDSNERATYLRNNRILEKNKVLDTSHVILWRNDELAFYGETLEEIGITLERIYNVKIVFTSEAAKKHSFAGIIKNSRLNNVFEIIGMTAPIEYAINDSVIRISERKQKR